MFMNAVPDLLQFRQMTRIGGELKQRLQTVSIEAVTGQREDITKATGGNVGGAHLLNKALQDIETRNELFQVTKSRLTLSGQVLKGARGTLDNMGVRVLTVLGSNSDSGVSTIINEAEAALKTVFSSLQINQGNRNLFSGDATTTPPLGDVNQLLTDVRAIVAAGPDLATINAGLDTYFNDPAGGFQTTIYQGGSGNSTPVLLANDTRLDFTIRADDPAIKSVMRGLAVIASADISPFDRFTDEYAELFDAGSFALNNGESGIVELESKLGIGLQLIANAEEVQEAERLTLTATYQEIVGRDQFEASAELKNIETQLEASYLLTAKLSELSLLNFIR